MYAFSCTDSGLVNNSYCRWETPKAPSALTTLLNNIEKNKKNESKREQFMKLGLTPEKAGKIKEITMQFLNCSVAHE